MSSDPPTESTPRARPVADAPIEALLARSDELARQWAIALMRARPLEELGRIPLADLAREAPALCAHAVRALGSDVELERLAGVRADTVDDSPARRLGVLAGAPSAQAAVAAAEALRGVLWEATLEELRGPSFDRPTARQVADLGDRLAYVCATALAATLALGPALQALPAWRTPPGGDRQEVVYSAERSPPGRHGTRIVDEREGVTTTSRPPAPGAPGQARPLPWDLPLRAERSEGRRPEPAERRRSDAWIADSAADTAVEGDDRVVRISRRP